MNFVVLNHEITPCQFYLALRKCYQRQYYTRRSIDLFGQCVDRFFYKYFFLMMQNNRTFVLVGSFRFFICTLIAFILIF